MPELLDGRRILVLEDDYIAAHDMSEMVESHGGRVAGPVGTLEQALDLARSEDLDGAILDVNLGGDDAFPVADVLAARGIPFIFVSAYEMSEFPRRFADRPQLDKPTSSEQLERTLRETFS